MTTALSSRTSWRRSGGRTPTRRGQSYEQFAADTKTQDAVIRTLEIVGEATKRLSPVLRESRPDVPWKSMAGLRDKLIHDYFGVDLDVVWRIVRDELPPLADRVTAALDETNS